MSRISSLTPDWEGLIPVFRERWRSIWLSTRPLDRTKAKAAVNEVYSILGRRSPRILFFKGPTSLNSLSEQYSIDILLKQFGSPLIISSPIAQLLGLLDKEIDPQLWQQLHYRLIDIEVDYTFHSWLLTDLLNSEYRIKVTDEWANANEWNNALARSAADTWNTRHSTQSVLVGWMAHEFFRRQEHGCLDTRIVALRNCLVKQLCDLVNHSPVQPIPFFLRAYLSMFSLEEFLNCTSDKWEYGSTLEHSHYYTTVLYKLLLAATEFASSYAGILGQVFTIGELPLPSTLPLIDYCMTVICSQESPDGAFAPPYYQLWEALRTVAQECNVIFPFENVCLVLERPVQLLVDERCRPHGEGEPAIAYPNGDKLYFFHGLHLRPHYGGVRPCDWKAQWFLAESNAELQRVLLQGMGGYESICRELNTTELDSWREYTLLKTERDVYDEPIHLLKMVCPSTEHVFVLRVPPYIQSAREAICWVNRDIDPESFVVQT